MASSIRPLKTAIRSPDRRAYPRVPVALPAFLQADGERHAVQIVDLSAGGAKLDCPASLPTGTAVILDCGTLGRSAVVRWNSAGVMGLCLQRIGCAGRCRFDRSIKCPRRPNEDPGLA